MKTDRIILAGELKVPTKGFKHPQRGMVYNPKGIAACLNGLDGRANYPKIIEYEH